MVARVTNINFLSFFCSAPHQPPPPTNQPPPTMIYDIHSEAYSSFLAVSPSSGQGGQQSQGAHGKKPEVKAKGSDGKYQGE